MGETDSAPGAEPGSTAAPTEQFATPSWLTPGGTTHVPRVAPQVAPRVPAQATPAHDTLHPSGHPSGHPSAPPRASANIPDTAHWVERRRPRRVVGALLVVSLLATLGFLVAAIITQATAMIVALAAAGFLTVLFRATLMSTGVTTTDLKGTVLKVRTGGTLKIFRLDDPDHAIEIVDTPGSPRWKVVLQAPDGSVVTLDASHVNADEMHPIAEYYRSVSERERERRNYRFNL